MVSCKKSPVTTPIDPAPVMSYINLHDSAVTFNKLAVLDLNSDGENDVWFSTLLVGDPIAQQDKKQWYITTSLYTSLPVNGNESIPVLKLDDSIPTQNFNNCNWYNAASVLLAEKVIGISGDPYWLGDWKEAAHKYIPLQVLKEGAKYNGWVEISFSTAGEKIILHRAALCKEKNKTVVAGK